MFPSDCHPCSEYPSCIIWFLIVINYYCLFSFELHCSSFIAIVRMLTFITSRKDLEIPLTTNIFKALKWSNSSRNMETQMETFHLVSYCLSLPWSWSLDVDIGRHPCSAMLAVSGHGDVVGGEQMAYLRDTNDPQIQNIQWVLNSDVLFMLYFIVSSL